MRLLLAGATIAAILSGVAARAASPPDVTAALSAGTLGVGPEIGWRANRWFGVRASALFLGFSGTGRVGGYRYDADVRLANGGGSIDLYPAGAGLRVSAGLRATAANHIRFIGHPRDPQTYGGVVYTPDQAATIRGTIRGANVSPLATIGYVRQTAGGISYGIDGGILFQGRPHIDPLNATGEMLTNPAAGNELARQEHELRDNVRDYAWYPIIQLSLGYRF